MTTQTTSPLSRAATAFESLDVRRQELRSRLDERVSALRQSVHGARDRLLSAFGVPSKAEIESLEKKLNSLSKKLKDLSGPGQAKAGRRASR